MMKENFRSLSMRLKFKYINLSFGFFSNKTDILNIYSTLSYVACTYDFLLPGLTCDQQ